MFEEQTRRNTLPPSLPAIFYFFGILTMFYIYLVCASVNVDAFDPIDHVVFKVPFVLCLGESDENIQNATSLSVSPLFKSLMQVKAISL